MAVLVHDALQSGWPQQPLRRERTPARPKPAKQRGPSPREKYGLQKLSDLPSAPPKQPAPCIVRPPVQPASQIYEQIITGTRVPQDRRKLFTGSPESTPGLRRKVCAQITHATSWKVLYRKVVPRYLLVFDSFITGVFFRRLPHMLPDASSSPTYAEDCQQFRQMMAAVYAVLAHKLHGFTPSTLACIVAGMAACDAPDACFLAHLEEHLLEALQALAPWQLPVVLRSLARLGHNPQQPWMLAVYTATAACWQQLSSPELVGLASSFAALRQQPPELWMEQLCAAVQQQLGAELRGLAPLAASGSAGQTSAAAQPSRRARQRALPGPAVIMQAPGLVASTSAASGASSQPAASFQAGATATSGGMMAVAPAAARQDADAARGGLLRPLALQQHASSQLSELLRAFGSLGYLPDDAWVAWACELLQDIVRAGACSPADLVGILEAWAELGLGPGQALLHDVYAALSNSLQALDAGQLLRLGQALQQLQQPQRPDSAWMGRWQQAITVTLPAMTTAQLIACLAAFHTLQQQPSSSWVSAMCLVSQGKLHAVDQEQLVCLLQGMTQLRAQVSPLWAVAVVKHVAGAVRMAGEGSWSSTALQQLLQSIGQLSTDAAYVESSCQQELQELHAHAV